MPVRVLIVGTSFVLVVSYARDAVRDLKAYCKHKNKEK